MKTLNNFITDSKIRVGTIFRYKDSETAFHREIKKLYSESESDFHGEVYVQRFHGTSLQTTYAFDRIVIIKY